MGIRKGMTGTAAQLNRVRHVNSANGMRWTNVGTGAVQRNATEFREECFLVRIVPSSVSNLKRDSMESN